MRGIFQTVLGCFSDLKAVGSGNYSDNKELRHQHAILLNKTIDNGLDGASGKALRRD